MENKSKRVIGIIGIVVVAIWMMFWIETRTQLIYRDQFRVAKGFIYGFAIQEKKAMKVWTNKEELNQKIDSITFNEESPYIFYDDFELVNYFRLGRFSICTYAAREERFSVQEQPKIFFYTVMLEGQESRTWWEKFHWFLFDLPVIGKNFDIPKTSELKWIVRDFYSSNAYPKLSTEELLKEMEGKVKNKEISQEQFMKTTMKLIEWLKNKEKEEENFVSSQIQRQNEQTKELYFNFYLPKKQLF